MSRTNYEAQFCKSHMDTELIMFMDSDIVNYGRILGPGSLSSVSENRSSICKVKIRSQQESLIIFHKPTSINAPCMEDRRLGLRMGNTEEPCVEQKEHSDGLIEVSLDLAHLNHTDFIIEFTSKENSRGYLNICVNRKFFCSNNKH